MKITSRHEMNVSGAFRVEIVFRSKLRFHVKILCTSSQNIIRSRTESLSKKQQKTQYQIL